MINAESLIFNRVAERLRSEYPEISVYGEYVETPSSFPAVSLVEEDNSVVSSLMTTTNMENFVDVVYSVNIYSNKASGKKIEAKNIGDTVDEEMMKMGFTRTMRSQIPNIDRTIYRLTIRYVGRITVEENGEDILFKVYGR